MIGLESAIAVGDEGREWLRCDQAVAGRDR